MRAKKTWLVTCGVLAGVCIAGTFGWTRAERQYQEDLAALRSMGVPTTAEELRELSRGPGENAADDYRKALEIWLTIPSGDRNRLMGWRQDMSEERLKAADRNEATLAQLCERLSLAASKEHANWETPWEQGHESLLEARRASWFINFLGGHVKDQIAAGEVDHALDSYLAALRISNHIREVRSEHFYSTSGWTGSNLSDSLELLLEAIQDDPQRLRKLLVGLEALPETPAPEYAMISNYVVTLYALRQVPEFHKLKGTVNGEPAPNNLLDRILDTGLGRRTLERALARDARTFWEELPRGAKNWREQAKAHRDHLVEVASAKHNSIGGYALATIHGNPRGRRKRGACRRRGRR